MTVQAACQVGEDRRLARGGGDAMKGPRRLAPLDPVSTPAAIWWSTSFGLNSALHLRLDNNPFAP